MSDQYKDINRQIRLLRWKMAAQSKPKPKLGSWSEILETTGYDVFKGGEV